MLCRTLITVLFLQLDCLLSLHHAAPPPHRDQINFDQCVAILFLSHPSLYLPPFYASIEHHSVGVGSTILTDRKLYFKVFLQDNKEIKWYETPIRLPVTHMDTPLLVII